MLQSLQQLVEYMTGMDARIGYPNEHLGKSLSDVKSPMYSTAIGLVLSGFMDLDDRQNQYNEARPVQVKSKKEFKSFLDNIINKTKGLLIDDIEENNSY